MSESEFGTTIGDIHGGEIIRTPEGEIIFLSSAFNSLTVAQLLDITEAMLKFKEQMSKPLGVKSDVKEHRTRKNPKAAEDFAAKRHATNAERPKQVWSISEQRWIR